MTNLLIPEAAFDKHVALLGMTGAGKTSVIKTAIVEPDLKADRRVLIITPKDDWWGLRLSKSGKGAGFDIPIFGGRHGDYPLQVKDAALLAETYGTMKGSAILCTSKLSVQDRARWFAAFAERLLSTNRGWVRVVIDEAHVFMPKQGAKAGGTLPAALHAGNELVSQGRSAGLRIVLASQRSAKLHNDSLTQCSCLIAMRLMAPHDRDAVKDWIEDQADPHRGKEIIASLATMNDGQAWVWAPVARFLECVQFPRPATFDSSAAPDDDAGTEHRLKPINLDALKGKLATIEAERAANDPTALKAEVRRLTKLLAEKPRAAIDQNAIMEAEERGFEAGKAAVAAAADYRIYETRLTDLNGLHDLIAPLASFISGELKAYKGKKPEIAKSVPFTPAKQAAIPQLSATHAPAPKSRPSAPASGNGALSGPEQRIVDAIRWWNVLGIPGPPTQVQVGFVAGYSHKSGTWATYLSKLRSAGLIDGRGGLVLTEEGEAIAHYPGAPPSGESLRAVVMEKIDGPLRRILMPILEAYPSGMSQAAAGEAAGYSSTSGTWATYLSKLRSLELIEGRGELKAQNWLFP